MAGDGWRLAQVHATDIKMVGDATLSNDVQLSLRATQQQFTDPRVSFCWLCCRLRAIERLLSILLLYIQQTKTTKTMVTGM